MTFLKEENLIVETVSFLQNHFRNNIHRMKQNHSKKLMTKELPFEIEDISKSNQKKPDLPFNLLIQFCLDFKIVF